MPTYRPGEIRTVRRGQVLVLHRSLRPIRATTVDVADRPDYPQLRHDVDDVRTGTALVTTDGYPRNPVPPRFRPAVVQRPTT